MGPVWVRTQGGGKLSTKSQYELSSCCYMLDQNGECRKVNLGLIDIGWVLIQRVEKLSESDTYLRISVALVLFLSSLPLLFNLFEHRELVASAYAALTTAGLVSGGSSSASAYDSASDEATALTLNLSPLGAFLSTALNALLGFSKGCAVPQCALILQYPSSVRILENTDIG